MTTITEVLEMIVKADVKDAKKNLDDLEKSVDDFKDTAEDLGKKTKDASDAIDDLGKTASSTKSTSDALLNGLLSQAAGWLSVGAAVKKAIDIFKEADAAATEERIGMARLQAVLDATGRSSETSAKRIDDFASTLEDSLKIDKQAIIDATASLATMGDISTDLFQRVFTASADLAATFGTDIGSAVESLGYALESPVDGITRLRRQGIFVSEEMTQQITYLTEQNRKYEAQLLLLDEVESKVKGTAEAIAEASASSSLSTSWNKFTGELGKSIENVSSSFKTGLSWLLNGMTSAMEEYNSIKDFLAVDVENLSKMSIAQLEDYLEEAKKWLEGSKTDYAINQWQTMVDYAEQYLSIALEAEKVDAAKEEATRKKKEEAEAYSEELERQKELTSEISALYASTDEGAIAGIESQIARLEDLKASDEAILATLTDQNLIETVTSRLAMYDSIIESTRKRLESMTGSTEKSLTPEDILGTSASDYVLNIPLSFDFGRTEKETLQEELSKVKSAIDSLWSKKPDEDTKEWNSSLDILVGKYEDINAQLDAITRKEEEEAKYRDLQKKAENEKLNLLSDEERAKNTLSEYDAEISELLDNKLITQEQYNTLLDIEKEKLGLITNEMTKQEKAEKALSDSWDGFIDKTLSVEALTSTLSSTFMDIGEALATDGDAARAASEAAARFSEQMAESLVQLAISAGLRCIVDGNVGLGLALLAIGGITGLGVGAMGASSKAISDDMQRQLDDELEARKKLTEQINSSIDEEYQLLKRQLDRNLISDEDFISTASGLQHQKDVASARSELSSAVMSRINELNSEYSSMNGWDKFWSGRDEDIKDEIANLKDYYSGIDEATEEELKTLIEVLAGLGVSTGGVSKFANGGTFTTTGPRLIAVGDNPSGIERVSITPSESQSTSGTTIVISGDVYGWEDMVGKLKLAAVKIERRRI